MRALRPASHPGRRLIPLGWLLAFISLAAGLLSACRPGPAPPGATSQFRVALLTPGPVSDGGWNAAAFAGLELIKNQLGADTAMVQTRSPADFDDAFRDSFHICLVDATREHACSPHADRVRPLVVVSAADDDVREARQLLANTFDER